MDQRFLFCSHQFLLAEDPDVCRPSWSLAGVVAVISLGLTLLVAGETQFNFVGFVLVMLASMLSGLRWTITQVLLQGTDHHGEWSGSSLAWGMRLPFITLSFPSTLFRA